MTANNSESKRYRVAMAGGTGYGGAELIRLLMNHPRVELARVTSIDRVGEPLEAVHLNLNNTGMVFEEMPVVDAAKGMDVLFLGLPHKVSSTLAPQLDQTDARVIDLSGDFRLTDKDLYAEYYGQEHPYPEQLEGGRWVYGLPEFNRELISGATRIASPGCFATTLLLGLLPLAHSGLLKGAVQSIAATGSSGSGAYASAGTHHPVRVNNMKIYKPLNHQHKPEIEEVLVAAGERSGKAQPFNLNFVPVSAPLARGILSTNFVSLPEDTDPDQIDAMFRDYYEDSTFVRVLGSGPRHAEVIAIKGSNWVDLSWVLGPAENGMRQLVIATALDNLVKGGAGQAVQSMNISLGLPEGMGIDAPALWP